MIDVEAPLTPGLARREAYAYCIKRIREASCKASDFSELRANMISLSAELLAEVVGSGDLTTDHGQRFSE